MAQQKETNKMILILIILAGLAGGYIYSSNYASPILPPPLPDVVQKETLSAFKNYDLNFKIFQEAMYQKLTQVGEFPVQQGNFGKARLFDPIQ